MDWDKLRGFHTVAEHLNMAHASRVLDISPVRLAARFLLWKAIWGASCFTVMRGVCR